MEESVLITPVAAIYDGGRTDVFDFSENAKRFGLIIAHKWSTMEIIVIESISDHQRAMVDDKISEICNKKRDMASFKRVSFKPDIRFLETGEIHGELDSVLSAVENGKISLVSMF